MTEADARLAVVRGADQVTRGYTSRVLKGRDLPLGYAEAFAIALGVRPAWLLAGDGEMLPKSGATAYADLPGWRIAAGAALERLPRTIPIYAVEAAARRPVVAHPRVVTPDLVIALARFWFEFADDAEVSRAERLSVENPGK